MSNNRSSHQHQDPRRYDDSARNSLNGRTGREHMEPHMEHHGNHASTEDGDETSAFDNQQRGRGRENGPANRDGSPANRSDRMAEGGSNTSAYGDEQSISGDRYRNEDMGGGGYNIDRDGVRDREREREREGDRDRQRGMRRNSRDNSSWLNAEGANSRDNDSMGGYDRDTSGSYSNRDDGSYGGRSRGNSGGGMNRDMQNGMNSSQRGMQDDSMPRGQHAGRGPKGYRRGDDRITDDVNEVLTHDSHVDASEIEVSVSSGEVTLSGTVDTRDAKRHAEDLVERVSGVNEVHNQIRVSKARAQTSTSDDMTPSGTPPSKSTPGLGARTEKSHS